MVTFLIVQFQIVQLFQITMFQSHRFIIRYTAWNLFTQLFTLIVGLYVYADRQKSHNNFKGNSLMLVWRITIYDIIDEIV